jgi:putative nucleotidyltransferase with HDIG domain
MNNLALGEVLSRIHKLPSLPAVVMELLASMAQEDVDIDELAKKIARDQALTAKTLRLANSSFYGMAHQITTIQEAISILGFRTVRSLVTTAALIGTFAGSSSGQFNAAPFWRHSIAAAVCARELASWRKLNPEYAYTAGLLHDIGRLVLVTQFQTNYAATMAYRHQHDCQLLDAEHAILGIDHAAVGHALTQHWKFPEAIQRAIAFHHSPEIHDAEPLTLIILASDVIAHALDLSKDEDDAVPPIPEALWQQLGMDETTLLGIFKNAEMQFEGASLVLGL